MSVYVAILLLGQVGDAGDIPLAPTGVPSENAGSAPAATLDPAVVTVDEPSDTESAVPRSSFGAPVRPGIQGNGIRDEVPDPAAAAKRRAAAGAASLAAPVPQSGAAKGRSIAAAPPTIDSTSGNSPPLQVATTMMEEILVMDESSQQNLRRVRLVDALSRLGDPGLQSAAIRAYWELARSIAHSRYAADKVRVLTDIPAPNGEPERTLLDEAVAAAEAEEAAAHDSLLAAQYDLLRATGLSMDDSLPWPADTPLIASYRTQFETIFANRLAPLAVRQIHHRLPGKLWLIEKRVSAVAAAESAMDALHQSHQGGRTSLDQLLAAIERLDRSRQAFLAAIVEYNFEIAEYSLAVVGPGVGPETLVSTLIKVAPGSNALVNIPPRDVRQAGAISPLR